MITLLNDLALLHNYDVVSVSDSRESMSNHNGSDGAEIGSDLVYCSLDLLFILFVKGRCGLIKEKNFRFLNESSGNGYPLLLTARELASGIADIGVDALLPHLGIDEVPSVC